MKKPNKLYLQITGDQAAAGEHEGVTWCEQKINETDPQFIHLEDNDLSFILDAINAYGHAANRKLEDPKKTLGDIEKLNLSYQQNKARELLNKLRKL